MAETDSNSSGSDDPRVTVTDVLLNARPDTQRNPSGNAADSHLQEKYAMMTFLEKYVLEIIFLLFVFPNNLLGTPITDVYMQKACLYELAYNSTVCDHFKDNNTLQKEIQNISNYYSTMKNIVSTLPGAAVSLIAGQYMSRYGMKGPMLLALLGSIMSSMLQWYTFYKMELPLYHNVLAEIPSALTGGIIVLSTAVYSNITLTCPASRRKTRFLIVQFVTFVPLLVAMSLGGFLYEHFPMTALQLSVVLLYCVPLVALLLLYANPERSESARNDSWEDVFWHSIGWAVIRKSFSYVMKKRPHFARAQIYFMFICLMIAIMGFSGTSELNYYYVNNIYKWEVIDFTTIGAVANALTILIAVPNMWFFSDVLKMSDPEMVAACFFSYSLKYGLLSIAKLSIYLYYAQIVAGLPFMVLNISVRSHLSRLLDSHEVPVVFALTSSSEHLAPIASDYVNMLLYRWSEESFPGLAFACQSGLFLVPVVLGLICARWIRQYGYPNYNDILLGASRQHTA